MNNFRVAIAGLALSASAMVGIAISEGYEPVAKPPLPGDHPTNGFGAANGVKIGERTDPVRALIRLRSDASEAEKGVKSCVKVPLYQHEYDAFISFTFNMGAAKFCGADFVKRLNAGDYEGACKGMATHPDGRPAWSHFQGRYIQGLQDRRIRERDMCLGKS